MSAVPEDKQTRNSQLKNTREAIKSLKFRLGDAGGNLYDNKEGDKVLWFLQAVEDILDQYTIGAEKECQMTKADACTVIISCLQG